MKTITEMQSQIKEMSSKLDEFARELSDYNQSEKQSSVIDFKQIKAIGIRNPIIGHILEKVDASVKKKYITMLIAIAYMAKEKQENAWLLVQRIATGANFTEELIDLSVDAINITDAQIDEFTLNIASAKLSNAFVLDAILIYLSCENSNDKMLELLSALFELVKCGKKEVQELSELAKSIACQDNTIYSQLIAKKLNILLRDFVYYTKNYVIGVLYNENNSAYLIGNNITQFDEKLYQAITQNKAIEKIIISGFCFTFNETLSFENVSIEFENCQFENSSESLYFNNCNDIVLTKCKAANMINRVACLYSVNSFKISDCKFINCGHTGDSDEYGGVFLLNNTKTFVLKNSVFSGCYIARTFYANNYYATGVIALQENQVDSIVISDCNFNNSKCIQNEGADEVLFYNMYCEEMKINNNTITGKVQKMFNLTRSEIYGDF